MIIEPAGSAQPSATRSLLRTIALACLAKLLHLDDLMQPAEIVSALAQFGLRLPYPSTDFDKALAEIEPLLVTAVPLGICNFTEGMNNVESAVAAHGDYSLRKSCSPTAAARCSAARCRPASLLDIPYGRQSGAGSAIPRRWAI